MKVHDYEPTPVRDLWTRFVVYARVLFSGAFGICGRCGKLSEVYRFGDNVVRHRAAGERFGKTSAPFPLRTHKKYLFWFERRVCLTCDLALGDELQTHEGCWCRRS